jgi:PDZ domain-containing protein
VSDPSKLSRRYTTMLVAALSLIVLTCLAFLVPVPYVTMRPGPAFNTLGEFDGKPMFTFADDVKTYPTSGTLDFTTVSVTRADANLPLGDVIGAWFDDDVAVVPKSLVYPDDESQEEASEQSAAQLSSSKDSSRVAALRAAGYTVPGIPTVESVVDGGASEGRLEPGDQIRAIDGTRVDSAEDTVKAVGTHEPGDTLEINIVRDGDPEVVDVVAKPDPADPDVPRIGVTLGTTYRFPFEIANNVGDSVGGPSAGGMFALAIYDKLTPGELTGGRRVAGTGTITAEGDVGPIGGVRQKMAGAAEDKAEVFLVPAANCAEAAEGDDFGLTLVEVTDLDSAITALEKLADDPKAKVPTCR